MTNKSKTISILFVLLAIPLNALAQGIVPADRRIDWGNHAGVPGGIPDRTNICTRELGTPGKLPSFVQSVTATDLTNTLNNCSLDFQTQMKDLDRKNDPVVLLHPGTYNLGYVNVRRYGNLTLRGAGPGKTILRGHLKSDEYSFSGETTIVGSAVKGTTSVQVTAPNVQFFDGNLIRFDQDDDPSLVFSTHGVGRHIASLAIITKVEGTTITFTPPLPYAFTRTPKVSYLNGGPGISWFGVEELTIQNDGGGDVIALVGAHASWVKNVDLTNLENTGVFFVNSLQSEVRNSYIHYAQGFPANSDGFGVYLYGSSSFNRIENNIFEKIGSGVLQSNSSGNAVLYNYSTNITFQNWPYQTGAYNSNHGAHPIMVLWEGNVGEQWQCDGYHGSASHQTLFRNNFHGFDPNHVGEYVRGNRKMISAERGSYFFNVVGNVLGDTWATATDPKSRYEMTENGIHYLDIQVIYRLGYPNMGNNGFSPTPDNIWPTYVGSYPDPKVKSTMLRHGNYDYYSTKIVWDPAIADQAIPQSLFYASEPGWWPRNYRWPPIGPELTPMVSNIPAKGCFESGAKDSGGSLVQFDPSACYLRVQGFAPNSPRGLSVTTVN